MSDLSVFRIGAGLGVLAVVIMASMPGSLPAPSDLSTTSGKILSCDFHSGGRYSQSFSKIVLDGQNRYFETTGASFRQACKRLDEDRPTVILSYHDQGRERYAFSPLYSSISWSSVDIWSLRTPNEEILSYGRLLLERLATKLLLGLMIVGIVLWLGWLIHDRATAPEY